MRSLLFLFILSPMLYGAVYQAPGERFSFEYDASLWELLPPKEAKASDPHTQVILQHKKKDEDYHARFSVVVDELDTKAQDPLKAYATKAVEFLENQRFRVLRRPDTRRLPHFEGRVLETTATQRDFGLTFKQLFLKEDSQVLLVSVASRDKSFEEYEPEFEKIINSLRIKPR